MLKKQREKRKFFAEKDIWRFAYEIALALDYLHSHKIIHRDIKCLNIFLNENRCIKIGDLGVSKVVGSLNLLQGTRVGTPLYLSPELVKQQPYDYKIDIWAMGCVLYHVSQLEPPFSGDNLIVLGNNIVSKHPKPLPPVFSSHLQKFVDKLMAKKAVDRPNTKEMIKLFPSFVRKSFGITEAEFEGTEIATGSTTESVSNLQHSNHIPQPMPHVQSVIPNNNAQEKKVKISNPVKKSEHNNNKLLVQPQEYSSDNQPIVKPIVPKVENFKKALLIKDNDKESLIPNSLDSSEFTSQKKDTWAVSVQISPKVPENSNIRRPENSSHKNRPTLAMLRSVNTESVNSTINQEKNYTRPITAQNRNFAPTKLEVIELPKNITRPQSAIPNGKGCPKQYILPDIKKQSVM